MGSPSMYSHSCFLLSCPFFVFFFFFLFVSQPPLGSAAEQEDLYHLCAPFQSNCGKWNISYPFSISPNFTCGLASIHCENHSAAPFINYYEDDPQRFEVKSFRYADDTIVIHDQHFTDLIRGNSCGNLLDFTLPPISGDLSFRLTNSINFTFLICPHDDATTDTPAEHDNGLGGGFKRCGDKDLHFSSDFPHPGEPQPPPPPPPPPGGNQSRCRVVEYPVDERQIQLQLQLRNASEDFLFWVSLGFGLQWSLPQSCPPCKVGTYCLNDYRNQGALICADPNPPSPGTVIG